MGARFHADAHGHRDRRVDINPDAEPEPHPGAGPEAAEVGAHRDVHTASGHRHSDDHTWLQGELDRHYRGHLDLRYRPASEEDAFGGKVRLENDPRLAEFRAGDVVAVEGELVRDPEAEAQPWGQYPRYHIRSIHLVERK